jgi:uncharacterized protein (DUF433 family)
MDWRDLIRSDPEILAGKPTVAGTRLSVEFLLGLFASGWTEAQVLESYPSLTRDAIRAVFAYAADSVQEDRWYPLPTRAAA